jgi:prepilin-type N-terminal cleavage/methylation domain-containing protein
MPLGHRRVAFTLVELMVAIAIAAILIAILLPAIQAARAAARRSQCQSNLRQIGVALANYESQHRMWPGGASRGLSWQLSLLPQLEQPSLAALIDYSQLGDDAAWQIRGIVLSTYVCPEDPMLHLFEAANGTTTASTNYLGNSGTGVLNAGFDGIFRNLQPWKPAIYSDGPVRSADVKDGLSHTAAVAEVLHSLGFTSTPRLRMVWNLPQTYSSATYPQFLSACQSLPEDPAAYGYVGSGIAHGWQWVRGSIGYSTYNHSLLPMEPSCFNGTEVPTGIYSAGSGHRSVTHLLFADGHTAAVSHTVNHRVWVDFGSRNGSASQ